MTAKEVRQVSVSRIRGSNHGWASSELDLQILRELVPWFRARLGDVELHLAGSCQGARMAIEYAGGGDLPPTPLFLISPYLRKPFANDTPIDPLAVECLRASLKRAPTWLLVGEPEEPDVLLLLDRLGSADGLELETVPGVALHLLDQPQVQGEAGRRLLAHFSASQRSEASPFGSLNAG